jgi:hypothetical protein
LRAAGAAFFAPFSEALRRDFGCMVLDAELGLEFVLARRELDA